jgi:2-methylisocitrate lyase-like PEP mutase family enzyme
MNGRRPGERLRERLVGEGVLAVLGVTSARVGQQMQRHGVEAGFVGTSLTFGNYTGLPDTGVASASECVDIGRYIANAVSFPVLLDGDTGHGGPPAVRRLVRDAIRAGLAGIRLDDQPIELKRRTQSDGIMIVSRDAAVERYRTAVDARDELDPSFVIMAQCYARDAGNGGLEEALHRLACYSSEGGVDWVQLEAPHSIEEVAAARKKVDGPLSVMQGRMDRPLTLAEHAKLGLDAAWYTFLPGRVLEIAGEEFLADFQRRGIEAWTDLTAARGAAGVETSSL